MSDPVPLPIFPLVLRLLLLQEVLLLRTLNSDCYRRVSTQLFSHIRLLPVLAPVWTGSWLVFPVSGRIWSVLAKNSRHIRSLDAKTVAETAQFSRLLEKCRLDSIAVLFRISDPVFVRSIATSNLHNTVATVSALLVDVPFTSKDLSGYKLTLTQLEWKVAHYDMLAGVLAANRASLCSLSVVLRDSPSAGDVIDEISKVPGLTDLTITFQEQEYAPEHHYAAKNDELFRLYKLSKKLVGLDRLLNFTVVLNAPDSLQNVQFNNVRLMLVIGLFNKVNYSRLTNRFKVVLNVPQIGHNENLAFLRDLPIKVAISGGNSSANLSPKDDPLGEDDREALAFLSKEYSYLEGEML